ncbi:transposase, IS30 family [Thiovulum sp. ES]|nr:transposase, IS30 family [Thiovulum sp. ES]
MNTIKKYKPYKRLTEEQKELIFKLHDENIGQRAIARTLGVYLRTVQYHLKKKEKLQKVTEEKAKLENLK